MEDRPFLSPWQVRVVCEDDDSIQILVVYKHKNQKTNEIILDLNKSEIEV